MLADTPWPRGFGAALASVDTFFPRAPEQFVTSPLCLVGYVRWDARSDRVPPLQTIIFSSFPGRTKGCRPTAHNAANGPRNLNAKQLCSSAKCNQTPQPSRHEDLSRKGFYQVLASAHSNHLSSTRNGIEQTHRHAECEICLIDSVRRRRVAGRWSGTIFRILLI